ncbi:MAG: hypothetical protein EPO51_20765 [Phenylobacterium sp.]|uniref:hypothetical protein n=1 Tax=Phenylobacterium sp. TaxID=1871053 RepID=UPI00121C0981|nr:hypothetical protein [Phenylobacterium sp.]TAJ69956.1 MAG: hypothetical protein EPO51_20765 [Phenylobacterium sp.]
MVDIQGEGEILEGLGAPIRKLLEARDGQETTVRLASGEELAVYDVAWGRDIGDLWEHVTANCSPGRDGQPIHFFHMSEVTQLVNPETGAILIEQTPGLGET